jgi:nucleotidyltransferase/DNA polymerase involved in DNA repair
MILTPAGQEMFALFERVEAAIDSCVTSLDMIAGQTGGRVSIGAVSTAKYFVPFVIAAFSKLYPGIDISLTIVNRQEIRQALPAMPSVTAKRQCPELIFVKPRFEVYKAISQQIREIFAEHTPVIEPLSLDEAYLDVTENLQKIPLARDVALAIRAKIKGVTGLNASAGIKFLPKLASDHRKPNGQYVITPEMGPAFVESSPVGRFHGIGPATSAKMNALRLFTGLDMRNQTLDFMQAHFGKAGAYCYWISRGIDHREVRANRTRKSVGTIGSNSVRSIEKVFSAPNCKR